MMVAYGLGAGLFVLYVLAVALPALAVHVRRLHDINRSGWWVLLGLLPPIGTLILLIFLATASKPELERSKGAKDVILDVSIIVLSLVLSVWSIGFALLLIGKSEEPLEYRLPPSALINRAAPDFNLPTLSDPGRYVSNSDLKGKVWLLVAWDSQCESCREQNKVLHAIAQRNIVKIYGLNLDEEKSDAVGWLRQFGNPFVYTLTDDSRRVFVEFSIMGFPESFLIDENGIIRHRFVGPITYSDIDDVIVPKLKEMKTNVNKNDY
jgi:cytochrome c biogenesis protein CcmG/thiol:disulfide interchange protein DsbE